MKQMWKKMRQIAQKQGTINKYKMPNKTIKMKHMDKKIKQILWKQTTEKLYMYMNQKNWKDVTKNEADTKKENRCEKTLLISKVWSIR